MHTRGAWIVVVISACLAWCAPAGAATVSGSLQLTDVTTTSVSFSATAQRTCVANEQCDYYADLLEIDGTAPCPTTFPGDQFNIWNGEVLNTGPSTETATVHPTDWLARTDVPPSQLCLYVYADHAYYLVASAGLSQPPPPAGNGTAGGTGSATVTIPGSTQPKGPGSAGSTAPGTSTGASTAKLTCARYAFQQDAQKALKADASLAARIDRNHNGVACQGLPKRKTYIRTLGTAASATAARAALRHAYGQSFAKGTSFRSRCERRSRIRVRCTVAWEHEGTWTGYVDVVGAIRANQQALVTHVSVRRPQTTRA